jgi:hypothetical protein
MSTKMTYQFPFTPDEHLEAARMFVCSKLAQECDYSEDNVVYVYNEAFEKLFIAGDE